MKKVSLARVKHGKNAQEYCTIRQKRITGRPLADNIHWSKKPHEKVNSNKFLSSINGNSNTM